MFIVKLVIFIVKSIFALINNILKFIFGSIFLGAKKAAKSFAGAEDYAKMQYAKTRKYAEDIKVKAKEEINKQL